MSITDEMIDVALDASEAPERERTPEVRKVMRKILTAAFSATPRAKRVMRDNEVNIDPASVTLNGEPAVWNNDQGWVVAPPSDPRWVSAPILKTGDRVISNGRPAVYDGHDFAPAETARAIPEDILNYEAPDFTEDDGYLLEAALQAGSVMLNDDGSVHAFKQEDLLRLIKCAMDRDFTPLWEKPTEGDGR